MDYKYLEKIAEECGFTYMAELDPGTIVLHEEVRQMCADNTCQQYGRCWSCPPGCGTLDECRKEVAEYKKGILVQTVGDIEDSFDFEAIKDVAELHKKNFTAMLSILRQTTGQMLPLGAGCCTRCAKCTYPDAPCRFPDQMVSSMEAYGILVVDVCKANHLEYYYGSDKIAYTSCFLI